MLFKALLVFTLAAVGDVFWTLYIKAVGDGKSMLASVWAALIWAMAAYSVVNYVNDMRLIPFGVLGAFAGTYGTMKWKAHK
jgi:hypothetical protein